MNNNQEKKDYFLTSDSGLVGEKVLIETERIHRIKSLWIENFRGIKKLKGPLNTDADVILITGPNGFGKTSLVDAICLLLTGHYYSEREPLLYSCEGLQDKVAQIKAEALTIGVGGEITKEIIVSISGNSTKKPPEITGFTWPDENFREILARSSFFYQDLVHRLFDEGGAEKTLRDFLAPAPTQIEETHKAIKGALEYLRTEEKNLFSLPGIPSEEEIKNKRSLAIQDFSDKWMKLTSVTDLLNIPLSKRSDDWLFVIRSGNLRSGWQGELRNLANECLELFFKQKIDPLPDDTEPTISLQHISRVLQKIELQIASRLENGKQLTVLVNSLPTGSSLISNKMIANEKIKLEQQMKEIKTLKEQMKAIESIERHFQNPDGPGLHEIFITLRENSIKWLNLPAKETTEFGLPENITQWLNETNKYFCEGKIGLDESLDKWQKKVTSRRIELRDQISEKEFQYLTKSKVIEVSDKVFDLTIKSPQIRLLIEKATDQTGVMRIQSIIESLSDNLLDNSIFCDDYLQEVAKVKESLSNWIQVEESSKYREESLRRMQGCEEANKHIDSIRKALENESPRSKGISILDKVLELPEKEIKRFSELVNEIMLRFRIVKGIYPLEFEQGHKGKGRERSRTWDIFTHDKRPLSALSTGQKAQLGISLLISLNITLDRLITHSIIALDDTTTAFDMAQLPREAALLRQIAYNASENDLSRSPRRQLFIVSHHEDLTHRLIDFLIPPEGRTMHILNFVNWLPEKGPTIEQYKIEPALSVNYETKVGFGRLLESIRAEV